MSQTPPGSLHTDRNADLDLEASFKAATKIGECGCRLCRGQEVSATAPTDEPPEEFIPMETSLLISRTFGDLTKDFISWEPGISETVDYYISDLSVDNLFISSSPVSAEYELYINDIVEDTDSVIDLDFEEVDSITGAQIIFVSTESYFGWGPGTLGQVVPIRRADKWLVLFRDTGNSDFDQNTIIHEFGHALGLSHPGEKPNNPAYNTVEHTVMSYNNLNGQWGDLFTSNDLNALEQIWGSENDLSAI